MSAVFSVGVCVGGVWPELHAVAAVLVLGVAVDALSSDSTGQEARVDCVSVGSSTCVGALCMSKDAFAVFTSGSVGGALSVVGVLGGALEVVWTKVFLRGRPIGVGIEPFGLRFSDGPFRLAVRLVAAFGTMSLVPRLAPFPLPLALGCRDSFDMGSVSESVHLKNCSVLALPMVTRRLADCTDTGMYPDGDLTASMMSPIGTGEAPVRLLFWILVYASFVFSSSSWPTDWSDSRCSAFSRWCLLTPPNVRMWSYHSKSLGEGRGVSSKRPGRL